MSTALYCLRQHTTMQQTLAHMHTHAYTLAHAWSLHPPTHPHMLHARCTPACAHAHKHPQTHATCTLHERVQARTYTHAHMQKHTHLPLRLLCLHLALVRGLLPRELLCNDNLARHDALLQGCALACNLAWGKRARMRACEQACQVRSSASMCSMHTGMRACVACTLRSEHVERAH